MNLQEREQAHEALFTHQETLNFLVTAQANKLTGHWVAELLNLTEEESEDYAEQLLHTSIDSHDADHSNMIKKIIADLSAKNIKNISEATIRETLNQFQATVYDKLMNQ